MSANSDSFNVFLQGWQGDPLKWQITALNSDQSPRDVSLWIVMFTVKRNYTDTDDQAVYKRDVQMPATISPITRTGTTVIGSAIVTALSTTSDLTLGQPVTGTGIPGGTTLLSIDSSSQIHLSANATANGTPTLSFITQGILSGELPDTNTQNMAVGSYPFDVRVIIPPSSKPQRIIAGKIGIGKSVGTRIVPYNLVIL
jgi:hypothetical protein